MAGSRLHPVRDGEAEFTGEVTAHGRRHAIEGCEGTLPCGHGEGDEFGDGGELVGHPCGPAPRDARELTIVGEPAADRADHGQCDDRTTGNSAAAQSQQQRDDGTDAHAPGTRMRPRSAVLQMQRAQDAIGRTDCADERRHQRMNHHPSRRNCCIRRS